MIFTIPELIIIGGLAYFYWEFDNSTAQGERGEEVELENRTLEKRMGSQVPTSVVNQKEFELIKRNVPLPVRPKDDPSRYDASLDMALRESAGQAYSTQPLRPNRLEEFGTPSWRNAGKVLTDMLYFQYPREPVRPPDWYYSDF
jgi:hypothetical protein